MVEAVLEPTLLPKAEQFALDSNGELMARGGAIGLGRERRQAARKRSAAIDSGVATNRQRLGRAAAAVAIPEDH